MSYEWLELVTTKFYCTLAQPNTYRVHALISVMAIHRCTDGLNRATLFRARKSLSLRRDEDGGTKRGVSRRFLFSCLVIRCVLHLRLRCGDCTNSSFYLPALRNQPFLPSSTDNRQTPNRASDGPRNRSSFPGAVTLAAWVGVCRYLDVSQLHASQWRQSHRGRRHLRRCRLHRRPLYLLR
jgi:hypothetical protein